MSRTRLLPQLALLSICILSPMLSDPAAYAGPTRHVAKKDAKQEIVELENQWRTATMAGDVASLDKLLADDYVGISWTGQVNTKAAQLDRLRDRTLVVTRMDLSDVKVRIVGQVGIVTCRSDLEGTTDGTAIKGMFLYTRIYQRSPTGLWKITNFEATRIPPGGRNGRHGGKESTVSP